MQDHWHNPTKEELLSVWDKDHTIAQICAMFELDVKSLYHLKHKYNIGKKPYTTAGERNGNWKGGWEEYYGPNWEYNRNATRRRDNYRCRRCGVTEEEMGRQCDVHHLKPFRTFNNDYEKANALPNLISCCPDCHTYIERHPQEPIPAEPDPTLRTFDCPNTNRLRSYRVNPSEVAAAYEKGDKVTNMMKQFEANASEIYRALRRAGIKPARKNDVDWNEVRRLAATGLNHKQIAEQLGCNLTQVYRIIPGATPFSQQSEVVAKILELGHQGLGTRAIAKATGAGRTQVRALLRSNGIGPASQPTPAGGVYARSKESPAPELHPCACGCGKNVDISTRKGKRRLGPHYIHGHHRRGTTLNANQLAAVAAHTFKPVDPAMTARIRFLLGTMPQRQIAATCGVSQALVSKIAVVTTSAIIS